MAANPAFSIFQRDRAGDVDSRLPANVPLYTVVEKCLKNSLRMLEHPDVQRAFVTLAEEFKEARAGAPGSSKMKSKDTGNMEKDTKDFFASILTHFPTMIVDYSILEPGEEAFHIRRAVKTAFDLRLQSIHLNGKRVDYMAAAASRAKTEKTANNILQYHRFVFLYSNTILHELAHVFITYLGRGRSHTPDEINEGKTKGYLHGAKEEAGGRLEKLVFGGLVSPYRKAIVETEDKSSGVPYICKEEGLYRIERETIDKIVGGQIELPYRYSGSKEKREMLTMGSDYAGPASNSPEPQDPLLETLSVNFVKPLPSINIDHLWRPSPPRSGSAGEGKS